jgi:hypothetical protein
MTRTRQEILKALAELGERYPNWRFGQMVSNVSFWAKGPRTQAIWDVEDQQFLETINKQLNARRGQPDNSTGLAAADRDLPV